MNENEKKYYFSVMKLILIIMLMIYSISSKKSLHSISVEWFLLTVTLVAALGYELIDNNEFHAEQNSTIWIHMKGWLAFIENKWKLSFLLTELSLTVILLIFFGDSNNGQLLIPMVILDTMILLRLSFVYSLLAFLGVFVNLDYGFTYMIYCMFIIIIYYQNFTIIEKYRRYLEEFEKEEFDLKDSIHTQDSIHREELEKSSLSFENKMLEEKARLSQALHDKLGHSINGSIYQLEACKVLLSKDKEQSASIMQGVIDNLRSSMDEIRVILRREKPDKKRMAYLQLVQLCEECREKYGIKAEFLIDGEDKQIPELIWEVILDNSIEAVTNALKYSQCTELSIKIILLHKVARCSISDNGIGCSNLKEGMGIQGMKSRVNKTGGYIDISHDNGFHINMIIPL